MFGEQLGAVFFLLSVFRSGVVSLYHTLARGEELPLLELLLQVNVAFFKW